MLCHGKPMMLAGEEKAGAAQTRSAAMREPVAAQSAAADAPYWQCSKCHYVVQAVQPPETCPSCHEACEFTNVTCYIPECGFSGPDARLIGNR